MALPQVSIRNVIQKQPIAHNLRSYIDGDFEILKTKCVKYGDRAFTVLGRSQWNKLPEEIRQSDD